MSNIERFDNIWDAITYTATSWIMWMAVARAFAHRIKTYLYK